VGKKSIINLNWFLEAGLTEETPITERHRVFFLNRLLLVSAFINITMFFVDMMVGLYINAISNLMIMLIYGPLFFLHHEKKYYSVRNLFTFLMVGFVAYMSVATYHHGRWTETENIMFGCFAGAMFMYGGKARIFILVFMLCVFFGLKYYKFNYFETPINEDFTLTIINSSIALIAVSFFMIIYEGEFKKSINHVVELNLELVGQKRLLEQSKLELSEINKTNTKLFSIIAHDLKNPLNLINGLVHLCDDNDITKEELQELKYRTRENLNTVIQMIDNVLIWAKAHLEGFNTQIKRQNLSKLCWEISKFYQEILLAKNITISIEIDPKIDVMTDNTLMKIVIRNIVNNAIKYTHRSGKIRIVAHSDGQDIILKIVDTGVGIDQETIRSIENGEFVESQYGTDDEIGTGLGLLLSIEMLKKTKGYLQIESELGAGTTIRVTLPNANHVVSGYSLV
jgi:signal transduction histidine kinase